MISTRACDVPTHGHSHDSPDTLNNAHGPERDAQADMLRIIGARSLDALIDATLPASIRLKKPLRLPAAERSTSIWIAAHGGCEEPAFNPSSGWALRTTTPSVILRNLFEIVMVYAVHAVSGGNRPRPARIALNFQTMVRD